MATISIVIHDEPCFLNWPGSELVSRLALVAILFAAVNCSTAWHSELQAVQSPNEIEAVARLFEQSVYQSIHITDVPSVLSAINEQLLLADERLVQITEALWKVDPDYEKACHDFWDSLDDVRSVHVVFEETNGNSELVVCIHMSGETDLIRNSSIAFAPCLALPAPG